MKHRWSSFKAYAHSHITIETYFVRCTQINQNIYLQISVDSFKSVVLEYYTFMLMTLIFPQNILRSELLELTRKYFVHSCEYCQQKQTLSYVDKCCFGTSQKSVTAELTSEMAN